MFTLLFVNGYDVWGVFSESVRPLPRPADVQQHRGETLRRLQLRQQVHFVSIAQNALVCVDIVLIIHIENGLAVASSKFWSCKCLGTVSKFCYFFLN